MSYWGKHYFKDKKTAEGFKRGCKFGGMSVDPDIIKTKRGYMVHVKE